MIMVEAGSGRWVLRGRNRMETGVWGPRAQCPTTCAKGRSEEVRGCLFLRHSHMGVDHQPSGFWNTGEKTAFFPVFLF